MGNSNTAIREASHDLFSGMMSFVPWVVIMVVAFYIWWMSDSIVKKKSNKRPMNFGPHSDFLLRLNTVASLWNMFLNAKALLTRLNITITRHCWKYLGTLKKFLSQLFVPEYSRCSSDIRLQRTWELYLGKTSLHL